MNGHADGHADGPPDGAADGAGAPATGHSVRLEAVTKRFSHALACDGAVFAAVPGEVHALVGENGAGKSTLMRVLYGMVVPDTGAVFVDDVRREFRSPRDAIAAGIGMVHQHFMLVGPLTAVENVFLGREPARGGWFDHASASGELESLIDRHGLDVPLDVPVERLGVGDRQRVEILKALSHGAGVLILDEPTAVLTPHETLRLFDVLSRLKAAGHAVIFISHRLPEVVEIADRVTVMRHGRTTATLVARDVTVDDLAARMVDGRPPAPATRPARIRDEVRFELAGVSSTPREGRTAVHDLDVSIRSGEIVGVAGVEGNGQTDFQEIAAGLIGPESGYVRVDGRVVRGGRRGFLDAGVSFVPEDRLDRAVVASFSVRDNLILGRHRTPPLGGRVLPRGAIAAHAAHAVRAHDIRPPVPETSVSSLSGGNQQKVVMARELAGEPTVIVASQPTRGVDVGAIAEIHARLVAACESGAAVLLFSAELEELTRLSHRIVVLYRGRIVGEEPGEGADVERIGRLMLGGADA